MKKIISSLFILITAAAFSGCIGGSGAVTAASAPQIMNSFSSVVIASIPRGNTKATLPDLGSGGGAVTTNSVSTRAALSCQTVNPATPIDADGDGISLFKQYTFNCSDFSDAGYIYQQQGTLKIVDKDDAIAGITGGYRYDFDMPTWYFKSLTDGLTFGGSYKGFWEGSGSDTLSKYNADFSGRTYGEYNLPDIGKGNFDYTMTFAYNMEISHDVVASNAAWNTGSFSGSGTYSWNGKFLSEGEVLAGGKNEIKSGNATLTWQMIDVTFDVACAKWYKSGKTKLVDGGGNIIEATFACSEVKTYFNGKLVEGVTW